MSDRIKENSAKPGLPPPSLDLSIILVNYKSLDYTRACLRSIGAHPAEGSSEIIIVDNASGGGEADALRRNFPKILLLENQTNLGFAKAVNRGILSSRGKYILLINNDAEILPGTLNTLMQAMRQYPDVGILGCRLLNTDQTPQESFGHGFGFGNDLMRKVILNRLMANYSRQLARSVVDKIYSRAREVGWVCGAAMFSRREALAEAGLMDENFFLYMEDVDLCLAVRKKGWKVRYTPEASILHHRGVSVAKRKRAAEIDYRRSQLYFYEKHYGRTGLATLKLFLYGKLMKNFLQSFFIRKITGKKSDVSEKLDQWNREIFTLVRDY